MLIWAFGFNTRCIFYSKQKSGFNIKVNHHTKSRVITTRPKLITQKIFYLYANASASCTKNLLARLCMLVI